MQILSVVPIARGIAREELSYYSTTPVSPGDIVSVPLRKRSVPALVTAVEDVRTKRAAIRTAPFSMRKITRVHTEAPLTSAFMAAVARAALYFAATRGAILNTLVPKALITKPAAAPRAPKRAGRGEVLVFQDEAAVRHAHYKSLTREHFARNLSLLVILPTRAEAEVLFEILSRGIEEHAVLLHTGLAQARQRAAWVRAIESEHPLLIIGTPSFLSLPRADLATIVVEHESSRHYKASVKPYTDYRTFASFLGETLGVAIILGDELLRLETLRRAKEHELTPLAPLRTRYAAASPLTVVDMRSGANTSAAASGSPVVSGALHEMVAAMHDPSERCFVYTLRRGLYPLSVCGDCGHLVCCNACGTPVVVHRQQTPKPNVFVCHRCSETRSARERCRHCESWKLVPLGVGSQRVAEALADAHPDRNVFLVDADAMTSARVQQIVERWRATPKGVLVGTEVAFPYLSGASRIAVASLDTLFSLPDFRAQERIFRTLLFLNARASAQCIVQTRNPEDSVFAHARSGNVLSWYDEELAGRRSFGYPPFSTLIKITTAATPARLEEYVTHLEHSLERYSPRSFPAFTPRVRGRNVAHTLLTLREGSWPDAGLAETLRALPPRYAIQVDPEHLL